jgi:hypothetical protein
LRFGGFVAHTPSDKIPVAAICEVADITQSYYFRLAREGHAPKSTRGVAMAEALEWLKAREAKKSARAEAIERLRALYTAAGTSGSGT